MGQRSLLVSRLFKMGRGAKWKRGRGPLPVVAGSLRQPADKGGRVRWFSDQGYALDFYADVAGQAGGFYCRAGGGIFGEVARVGLVDFRKLC